MVTKRAPSGATSTRHSSIEHVCRRGRARNCGKREAEVGPGRATAVCGHAHGNGRSLSCARRAEQPRGHGCPQASGLSTAGVTCG